MLTQPDSLLAHFTEWFLTQAGRPESDLPLDGNLAEIIAIWMSDGGADTARCYEAFVRAVVLIVSQAARGLFDYEVSADGQRVRISATAPESSAQWWILEQMEFRAALRQ